MAPLATSFQAAKKGFSNGVDGHGEKIEDYQMEAVRFSEDMLSAINKDIGPHLKQLLHLAAIGYNKSLLDRRDLYCNVTNKNKGARERLQRLRPVEHKLFGGNVGSLNKALKDEGQVCHCHCPNCSYLFFAARRWLWLQ